MSKPKQTTVNATSGDGCPCVAIDGATAATHTIARREFVSGAAAALAAIALAACGGTGDFVTSPGTVTATTIKLSDFPALANVNGVATTSVGGTPIAIVRTGTSSFAAFSRICPHQGTTIDVRTNGFQCPRHGATFTLSGQWTGGQRTSNLVSYPVGYDSSSATLTIGG